MILNSSKKRNNWQSRPLCRARLIAAAFVFACPFVLAKSPTVISHSPAKTVQCWEIIQDNQSFGTIKMSLAPQGARVEIQNLHAYVVCTPPTWRVSVFNPITKQELSSSIEKWARVGLPMDEKQGNAISTEKGQASSSQYAGMKAILFKFRTPDVGSIPLALILDSSRATCHIQSQECQGKPKLHCLTFPTRKSSNK